MRRFAYYVPLIFIALAILAACFPSAQPTPSPVPATNTPTPVPVTNAPTPVPSTDTPSPVPATVPPPSDETIRTITIFYTSDEHGYLEPTRDLSNTYGGAANLLSTLRERGYDPDSDDTLLISGGDMWTGPAVSTWFQGTSAVQVFNALGYDAAAIGNHDFDFGREVLRTNADAAEFPFLTANVTLTDSRDAPEFAQPYVIREVNGVQVAIVGLTSRRTPSIVMPTAIEGLAFGSYTDALRRVVPQARAEGAKLVIVTAHVCARELRALTRTAAELDIPLLAGGHCHTTDNIKINGVRVVAPGAHWHTFARIDIAFDTTSGQVTSTRAELVPVKYTTATGNPVTPDAGIKAIVAEWDTQIDIVLGEVIGYTETGIKRDGWPMYNLLVDAWLWYYPKADIAISNFGGYREDFPPGEITRADIVATWPFENVLVDVELTGQQVIDNLRCCGGAVAGLSYHWDGTGIVTELADGSPLDPDATYHVLVSNFMYYGGDDYAFSEQDPDGYETGIHWRDPAIEWIIAQESSPERPLETLLDNIARGPGR